MSVGELLGWPTPRDVPRAVSLELRLDRAQPPPVWPMRFRLKAAGSVEVFSWKFARTMVLPVGVYRNCSVQVLPG